MGRLRQESGVHSERSDVPPVTMNSQVSIAPEHRRVYDLLGSLGGTDMLHADSAKVDWDPDKKQWHVRVQTGEEVIKRRLPKTPRDAGEEVLRSLAVETARADGYDVDPASVAVAR
jgi:hypothetical protein